MHVVYHLIRTTGILLAMSMERATYAKVRKAAGSQSLSSLIEVLGTGWTANEINEQAKEGTGKGALHMAAWQGCIENVRHLLDIGCDINIISTGEFSYGKTPIFFAATRSRNDVVDYLLDSGAFVKIVNNKGQSVLSIASSHLSPQVISKIQDKEKEQSAPWQNFRASHSDGFEYGDLDPRFIDRMIRSQDVVTPLAINPTTKETRKGGFLRRNPHLAKERPEQPQQKTRQKKKPVISSLSPEEETELRKSWDFITNAFKDETEKLCNKQILTIIQLGDKQRRAWIPEVSDRLIDAACGNISLIEALFDSSIGEASERETDLLKKILQNIRKPGGDEQQASHSSTKSGMLKKAQLDSSPWKEPCQVVSGLSISQLEKNDAKLSIPLPPVWVDSVKELTCLQQKLQRCQLISLDTEWYDLDEETTGVATIQVAFRDGVSVDAFVVDLLPKDSKYQELIRELIDWLLTSEILLLGFALYNDIPKLERFVGPFPSPQNILDLQLLMTTEAASVPGLKACAARFSKIPLSKEEQCSDWSRRPLSQSQLEYAGLDAAILLFLLEEFRKLEDEI